MTLDNTICLDVETPHGNGVLEKVYLTELGLVMGKVFFSKEGIYINYQMSDIKNQMNLNFKPGTLSFKRRRKHVEMSL
jgi:hypothetical protein